MRERLIAGLFLFAWGVAAAEMQVLFGFAYMLKSADRVIIGRVLTVRHDPDGRNLVDLTVVETWRGISTDRVLIDASCRVCPPRALPGVGEQALLLLDAPTENLPLRLSQHGYGYLPIKKLDGQEFVEGVWSDELLEQVPTRKCKDGTSTCYSLAALRKWAQAR